MSDVGVGGWGLHLPSEVPLGPLGSLFSVGLGVRLSHCA